MTTWDTGEFYPRRRFRIRGPLTLLVLVGLLAGAAWFGYKTVLDTPEPVAVRVCTTPDADGKQRIAASQVKINVYNAGDVGGLAGDVSSDLRERGFKIGTVTNAPKDAKDRPVEVHGRNKDAPEIQLVLKHLVKPRFVADGRPEAEVDVFVGTEFAGLQKNAPTSLEVKSSFSTCRTATAVPTP